MLKFKRWWWRRTKNDVASFKSVFKEELKHGPVNFTFEAETQTLKVVKSDG